MMGNDANFNVLIVASKASDMPAPQRILLSSVKCHNNLQAWVRSLYLSGMEKIKASPTCRPSLLSKRCLVLELHKNDNMDSMKYFSDFLEPGTRDRELHLMFKMGLNY